METTIISRLKAIRKALGLTQKDFAARVGIAYAVIRDNEQGVRSITDRTIRLICDQCGVDERWFRFGDGNMFVDAQLDETARRRSAFDQFAAVFRLTPDKQVQLAALVGYDVDAADIYAQSTESTQVGKAKRNIARLIKAVGA
ncbi:MAG: helix-turn-helix transcriptional regulator [Selenomonadaceae bacterium]|nr:helix-turn-helix transcriptional regulator [Selenomonadaceae bacterium]